MKIGAYLKGLREKAGLTIRDVVAMTGEGIERDERGLSLKAAYYLSEIYGVDIQEIAVKMLGSKARIKKIKIVKKKRGRKKGSVKKRI